MLDMGDAGFVTGVVFGAATALAFLVACLYSAYKAIIDRQRIIRKNESIRSQRLEEAAEMAGENDIGHVAENGTAGASSTLVAGAASTHSLTTPALEERRPSAAFKPPPPPPEKQWEQKGVHYRSEGGVMHIHKSDSAKLSTGPGDESEKEPLMSASDGAGASSEDKAEEQLETQELETQEPEPSASEEPTEDTAVEENTMATTTTTTETTEGTETKVQVHVTVSVSEHDDKVITSTSTEGLKQLESSSVTETSTSSGTTTQVHKLFTTSDGSRTQTGTQLPDVTNGDPAAWV